MMSPVDLPLNFAISLSATLADKGLDKLFSKNLNAKFQSSYKRALKKWQIQQSVDLKDWRINDYWDLLTHLDPTGKDIPNEIQALVKIWVEESLQDEECAAIINNQKQDIILEKLDIHTDTLHEVSEKIEEKLNEINTSLTQMSEQAFSSVDLETARKTFQQQKDLETLTLLMQTFSFDLLEDYIRSSHETISIWVSICYDAWHFIIESAKFKIYDTDLLKVIQTFYQKWKEVVELEWKWYSPSDHDPNRYAFFGLQHDIFKNDEAENIFFRLRDLHLDMLPMLNDMASYIQDNYTIDLDKAAMQYFKPFPHHQ